MCQHIHMNRSSLQLTSDVGGENDIVDISTYYVHCSACTYQQNIVQHFKSGTLYICVHFIYVHRSEPFNEFHDLM